MPGARSARLDRLIDFQGILGTVRRLMQALPTEADPAGEQDQGVGASHRGGILELTPHR